MVNFRVQKFGGFGMVWGVGKEGIVTFGQSILGRSILFWLFFCFLSDGFVKVVVVVVVDRLPWDRPPPDRPKFRFFHSRHDFLSFCLHLGVFSWNCGGGWRVKTVAMRKRRSSRTEGKRHTAEVKKPRHLLHATKYQPTDSLDLTNVAYQPTTKSREQSGHPKRHVTFAMSERKPVQFTHQTRTKMKIQLSGQHQGPRC